MSVSTLPDAAPGPGSEDGEWVSPLSPWVDALDPRGTFMTFFLAVAGTVAVLVLVATALRPVTGG